MSKRNNWDDFKNILEQHHPTICLNSILKN